MESFTRFKGLVAPLDRANVDTDAIIPKQFLKSIKRTGFGDNLFDELRYLDHGEPGMDTASRPVNPEFVLNRNRYKGAQILLARRNFGCGSSREHAPWALMDYGFRVVIAPSFADIFRNNCMQKGMLPVALSQDEVDTVMGKALQRTGYEVTVDLENQKVTDGDGFEASFEIDPFRRNSLLKGLDDIGLTLELEESIASYEEATGR